MPLNLKHALAVAGITQNAWCAAIKQKNGKPLSKTAGAQILNWGEWPTQTDMASIKEQTELLLLGRGFSKRQLVDIWAEDVNDAGRNKHPVGVHTLQHLSKVKPLANPNAMEREPMSPETKAHFQIPEILDPFNNDINAAADIYMSAGHRKIRTAIFATAKNGGIIAVPSESGAGKTVMKREFFERIEVHNEAPIRIIQPLNFDRKTITAGQLCEAVILDLNPSAKLKRTLEGKARQAKELLKESLGAKNRHCMFIEEAHRLPIPLFSQLKSFWELEIGLQKMLSIILIGHPELRDILDARRHPEIREFINRCEIVDLPALDNELERYVEFKFKRVDKKLSEVFEAGALDGLRERLTERRGNRIESNLFPLHIHIAITKAMNACAQKKIARVTADVFRSL